MRVKKGFTLAEVLIVLMVIGVLAAITTPSLLKGATEARYKSAYQKALSTISNIVAAQRMMGNLPVSANTENADILFDILNSNLSSKGYILANDSGSPLNTGKEVHISDLKENHATTSGRYWTWIITEDNLAYLIRKGSTNNGENAADTTANCGTKRNIITSQEADGNASGNNVCFTIYVDVNGLHSGPNTAFIPTENQINTNETLPTLKHDRFPIYVGIDGATPGSQKNTITGRIAAGLK